MHVTILIHNASSTSNLQISTTKCDFTQDSMQIKNRITFKPIIEWCLNFAQIRHNNKTIYESFTCLIIF